MTFRAVNDKRPYPRRIFSILIQSPINPNEAKKKNPKTQKNLDSPGPDRGLHPPQGDP
jgi:hypothetical protein